MAHHELILVSEPVKAALARGDAVVALESTIISHGMPYPRNVETARAVEAAVREHGALPATIAVMGGQMRVGLTDDEIETLGQHGPLAAKLSRRDLPFALTNPEVIGATTVAATMIIAQAAGIEIFATGGIGGVHRGAERSFDISADLQELSKTSVAVICAGAKSILDIGLTQEVLETLGVPVIGYQTDRWPAFYTASSEFLVDQRLDSPEDIAAFLKCKWQIPLNGGALICASVPCEYAMDETVIQNAIDNALAELDRRGIHGKDSTPFLLAEITRITGGESLDTNIRLVVNNASIAARIAVAYCR